jgi:rubrerythrin
MPTLTPEALQALKMAMQNELDTVHIYKKMLEKVKNKETKEILNSLIEEEFQHKEKMQEKIKETGLPESDLNTNYPELPNRDQLLEIELENCTVSELINLAIENEKISQHFYKEYYQRFKNEEVKAIFKWLIEQEEEHIQRLKKEYDSHKEYEEVRFSDD